jgi:hypothetical protein
MSTSEKFESIIEDLEGIQFAKTPVNQDSTERMPKLCAFAKQIVKTDTPGCYATVDHQVVGESLVDCLEQLAKQVEGAKNIKKRKLGPILVPGGVRP